MAVAEAPTFGATFRAVMRSLFRKRQNGDGAMIALFLPGEIAAELAQPGGVAPTDLHLTLKVLAPDAAQVDPSMIERWALEVQRAASDSPALVGRVSGVGRFNGDQAGGGEDVVYATLDLPGLIDLYQRIAWCGEDHDDMDEEPPHDFTPHVTLAYGNGAALPEVPTLPVRIDRLTLAIGGERREFPFGGTGIAVAKFEAAYIDEHAEAVVAAALRVDARDGGFPLDSITPDAALEVEPIAKSEDGAVTWRATLGERSIDLLERVGKIAPVAPEAPPYRILKAEGPRRYTLGVAYPAARVGKSEGDAHGDFMASDELEAAAWRFMAGKPDIGLMHKDGTGGAAQVVESYIYRGPVWKVDDQEVHPGDWLIGAIWSEDAWPKVEKGDITGWSMQGYASRGAV